MISYNNGNVVQYLRQYEMFSNSLNLVKARDQKNMIIKQLTKLENKILELTNEIYEEEYYTLLDRECVLIEDESDRLKKLIELINQRLSYVEKRCNNHYQLTGETIDIEDILGVSTLDELEERIKIIEKYSKNVKLEEELKNEVDSLNNKITLASEKIEINKSLNQELEKSFCEVIARGINSCGFNDLVDDRDEIEIAYYEIEKSLSLAEINLELAKTSPLDLLTDCQQMFNDVKKDYMKYKEKVNVLKLMDIYDREVDSYEELLSKRKEINELFRYIKNDKFLDIVMEVVSKQYNTILMEQQDVNTYSDLTLERDRKLETLSEIEEENSSERFQEVLEQLIKNEKARQERILEEQRKIEEEEKKKKLEIERKKQEEILKRQRIIEDARKKEMEKRTRELLEQQQKSVLQPKRKSTGVSFETIKDISKKHVEEPVKQEQDIEKVPEKVFEEEVITKEKEDPIIFKDKVDIEKELFEEFNNKFENKFAEEELKKDNLEEKKLPDVSIDEYMKNFKESEFEENEMSSLFMDDDFFPNIPI